MATILLLTSYGIQASKATQVIVMDNLENYSRGSYDILVRPEGSRTIIEEHLQTVEENYIGDGTGGISIAEWEEIKNHPEVEIAAPVASLGYFASNTASIDLPTLDYPARFEWVFYTSDGVNDYPVTPPRGVYYFQFIDNDYLYSKDTYPDFSMDVSRFGGGMTVSYPQNYNLLTAIDPESEHLLTGIDFSELFREHTEEEKFIIESFSEVRGNAPIVPILQRESFRIPLSLHVTVEKLDMKLDEIYDQFNIPENETIGYELQFREQDELQDFSEFLQSVKRVPQDSYNLDLTNLQSPFDGTHLKLDEDFNIEILKEGEGGTLYNDSGKYYTASKIDYIVNNNQISVPIVKEGSPPAYKRVEESGQSYLYDWEAPFMIWQMGTFQAGEEENDLTSSPLGIYSTKEVKTVVDGKELTPTITPGSFLAAPTAGVTTMEAASLIKGDEPIDAIRIKLNHITKYNKEAQERIESLATELSHAGYVVDIVAGSSFKSEKMNVEGIGEVVSPWTTLGISQLLANAWEIDTLLSIGLFSLFGFFWFFGHLGFERNRLDKENDILLSLGWQQRTIRSKNMMEQLLLVSISILLSLGLAISLRLSSLALIVLGCFLVISIILIATIFYSNTRQNDRSNKYKGLASIRYYKNLLLPTMLALILAVCITHLQIGSIYELWTTSTETTLGMFVFEQGLSIRILIVISTVMLSVLVLLEAIQGLIYARKDEFHMFFVVGWTEKAIKSFFLKEVLIWAGISLVIGTVISSVISIVMNIVLTGVVLASVTSSVIYLIIVSASVIFRKYR